MKTEAKGTSGTGHGEAAPSGARRRTPLAVPAAATAGTAVALWLGASLNTVLWGAIVLAVALAVLRLVAALDAARRARH